MQIKHTWNCRASCTTSGRRHFVRIGSVWTSRKLVGSDNGVLLLSEKCVHDLQADSQTADHSFLEQKYKYSPYLQETKVVHQFGTNVLLGIFMGYALNAGRKLDG